MQNANTNNNNILWIDIAKFIAMFLVIYEHVVLAFKLNDTSYIASIRNIIVTFHMPLFFIISGYLYKQKSKSENYEKILWALIIPYFIYQFLYLPLKLGYYNLYEHIPLSTASVKCLIGILLGDNLGTTGSKYALSVCPACWFIMVMIQLRFIFAHVNMTIRNLSLIALFSFIILKFLLLSNIDLYFCLDNTLYAIPYFVMGYCLKNYKKINFENTRKKIIGTIITLIVLLCCWVLKQNYTDILLFKYFCGLFGSLAVIFFCQIFNNTNEFVDIIAKNTLFIIFYHGLLLFITKWLKIYNIMDMLNTNYEKLLFVIIYSVLIYTISYFTILGLKKLKWDIVLGKHKRGVKCQA